ncbi:Succinate Dehydrogenase [Ubiquinone] Iron-Sulfur Subunit [Manis pentadactyla]|nr:Succinate Dehydrogenase [Ubiquinone] Iron-Sulfur Subunit [Manis pentadactyla]
MDDSAGDGWTAASSASAPCSLLLLRAEPAPGSSCIPLRRDPLLRRRGPESRGGGGALQAREAAEAAEAAAPRSRASAAPASAAQRRRRQIYPY